MRDEDLKNLPQSIEGWRVREFLDSLGIKHTDVKRMEIDWQAVTAEVYATDANGRRVREVSEIDALDLSGEHSTVQGLGGPKMHQIVIPLVQVWDIPINRVQHGPGWCGSTYSAAFGTLVCERPKGHPDLGIEGLHAAHWDGQLQKW